MPKTKRMLGASVATVVMAGIVLASSTHFNWESPRSDSQSSHDTLTIQGAAGDTLTIPEGATIEVWTDTDRDGDADIKQEPQPMFALNPAKGTSASSFTVKKTVTGDFADNSVIKISEITNSGDSVPTGSWSSTNP